MKVSNLNLYSDPLDKVFIAGGKEVYGNRDCMSMRSVRKKPSERFDIDAIVCYTLLAVPDYFTQTQRRRLYFTKTNRQMLAC